MGFFSGDEKQCRGTDWRVAYNRTRGIRMGERRIRGTRAAMDDTGEQMREGDSKMGKWGREKVHQKRDLEWRDSLFERS